MSDAPRVVVLDSLDDVARMAAARFVRAAAEAVAARGRFSVALSGGETPRALFRVLAAPSGEGGRRDDVAWHAVHVWWGDERHVPPDDEQSNYRMAREALLDHVSVPPAQIHRIRTELPAKDAALAYDTELRSWLESTPGRETVRAAPDPSDVVSDSARFDLVLLGLGADAHTASLFPGSDALDERQRLAVETWVDAVRAWRITLTPPVLLEARAILVLAAGGGKATALARAVESVEAPSGTPARILATAGDRVEWLVDRAAAAKLRPAR